MTRLSHNINKNEQCMENQLYLSFHQVTIITISYNEKDIFTMVIQVSKHGVIELAHETSKSRDFRYCGHVVVDFYVLLVR